MPPARKHRSQYPGEFHVPGYNFLGPGTNLKARRFQKPINELDALAKAHDLNFENPAKDTWESDKEFIRESVYHGATGLLAAGAIAAKHYLGLDSTFRNNNANSNISHYSAGSNRPEVMAETA